MQVAIVMFIASM